MIKKLMIIVMITGSYSSAVEVLALRKAVGGMTITAEEEMKDKIILALARAKEMKDKCIETVARFSSSIVVCRIEEIYKEAIVKNAYRK